MAETWAETIRHVLTEGNWSLEALPRDWFTLAVRYMVWVDMYAESHDLTGIRDPVKRVRVFLLYPLRLVHILRPFGLERRVGVDMGTGAGVPGLGMYLGGWRGPLWLVERSVKKASLLEHFVRHELSVSPHAVRVIAQDVRAMSPPVSPWYICQGVNWLVNPMRRWVERRVRWGIPMVWITTPARAGVRFGGRGADRIAHLDGAYVVLMWNVKLGCQGEAGG